MVVAPREELLIGVVLAGGQSRRMGRDKAELLWRTDNSDETITWAEHARQRLHAVCRQVLVSGPNQGVPDRGDAHQGPLSGIATVLERYPDQRCVFMPVDMPWVTVATLQRLRDLTSPHGYFADSQFPLLLTADTPTRHCLEHLLAHQNSRDRSLRNLFRQLPPESVTVLTATQLAHMRNVNRPDDLGPDLYSLNLSLLEHSLT